MYLPWFPCTNCAQTLMDKQITRLVSHKQAIQRTPDHWQEDLDQAQQDLLSAGVELSLWDGRIGGVYSLMRDKRWCP